MEPEKKSNGAFVGLVIVVIILVIGGIYMWQLKDTATTDYDYNNQVESVTTEDTSELNTLEADITATDTNTGVDVEAVN